MIVWFTTSKKPFINNIDQLLTLINEIAYLSTLVLTLLISPLQLSPYIKFYLGCIYIGSIAFVFALNASIILGSLIIDLLKQFKLFRECLKSQKLSTVAL